MNSGQLPLYIEPRKFADNDTRIGGEIALSNLSRLADYQGASATQVKVELRFYHEEASNNRLVKGSISTELELTCQRCLEPLAFPVDTAVNLVMVWNEEQSLSLPESHDPWLITEDKMSVPALLEDEILLTLPVVALHDECPASLPVVPEPEGFAQPKAADNPFAVLASLKKQN